MSGIEISDSRFGPAMALAFGRCWPFLAVVLVAGANGLAVRGRWAGGGGGGVTRSDFRALVASERCTEVPTRGAVRRGAMASAMAGVMAQVAITWVGGVANGGRAVGDFFGPAGDDRLTVG